jgi:hypothetical protein
MELRGLKRYFLRLKEPAGKRKATIFLACFVFSAFFWLLLKLSKENQAVFSMPLAVKEIPAGLMIYGQSDSLLEYSIQTSGARLFASFFVSSKDSLSLPLSSLSRIDRQGETIYFLTSSQASARLAAGPYQGKTILRVSPDTVFFSLGEKFSKSLPVRVRAEISYEKRFGSYGPLKSDPDSVLLEGPLFLLENVDYVETEVLVYGGLNQTTQVKARLEPPFPHPSVKISPGTSIVTIPVEEFTEATLELDLEISCPENQEGVEGRLRLFPNRVQLTFLVSLRDYSRVDPSLFSAMVLCPEPSREGSQLEVIVTQLPDFVRLESVRPTAVDYLILK